MKHSWTIGRKLTIAFSVSAVLLLAASLTGLISSYSAKSSQARTARIGNSLRASAEVGAFVRGMDASQKLIIVAGLTGVVERSEAGLKGIADATREIAARLEKLKADAGTDQTRAVVDAIGSAVATWQQHHERVMALIEKQDFDTALTVDLGDSFAAQESVLKQCEALEAAMAAEAEANTTSAQRIFMFSTFMAAGVTLAAIAIGFVVGFVIRQITRALAEAASGLRSSSQQVASASHQVASSSQSLSQGATEQAASLEETSASMEEMASMTRQNAENSQEAATQVAETERLVSGANGALQELVASMTSIRESSGKVTKIIKTIDEIAFQTNILALNAAVEAARAGEAGMSFAVVADEVRNLAQRSAQAAKDTASLIEESSTNATSGSTKVDAVVTAMAAITASSGRVHGLVDEVSVASRQQAQGIDQVTQAIAQMEKVTQTTAATAEETAAASQELSSQAAQALSVVGRLETMVHGGDGQSAHSDGGPVGEARMASSKPPSSVRRAKLARARMPAAEPFPLKDTGTFGRF